MRSWIVVLSLMLPAMPMASAPAANRLNVLLIVSDDLRDTVGCYGNADVRTPHLDRLLKLNLAGVQYAIGDLKADDAPVGSDANKAAGNAGTTVNPPPQPSEGKPVKKDPAANAAAVQVDVSALLNARPVTTLTAGKLVNWTNGVDGGGKGNGYLTMAAALAVGDQDPKALPDNPLIPAAGSRPEMLLHYSNDEGQANQACVVEAEKELVIPVPKKKYSHMFMAWTSSEGGSPITVDLTYADGTSESRTVTIPDYYTDPPKSNPRLGYVLRDLAKWGPTNRMREKDHHCIHTLDVAPDAKRELASVRVTKKPGKSYLLFWAATGVLAASADNTSAPAASGPATSSALKAYWLNNNSFGMAHLGALRLSHTSRRWRCWKSFCRMSIRPSRLRSPSLDSWLPAPVESSSRTKPPLPSP